MSTQEIKNLTLLQIVHFGWARYQRFESYMIIIIIGPSSVNR